MIAQHLAQEEDGRWSLWDDPRSDSQPVVLQRTADGRVGLVPEGWVMVPVEAGERDYQAWLASQAHDPEDATLAGLAVCASMLETYGPECLPADERGQVTFERSMLGATAKCIRAFLAAQEKGA